MKYEYKKLFGSRIMLFIIVLTLCYMIYLPLREVWKDTSELRKRISTYETIISEAKADNKSYGDLYNEMNAIFTSEQGENNKPKAKYSDDPFLDVSSISLVADYLQYITVRFEVDRNSIIKGMIYQNNTEKKKTEPDTYLIAANEKAIEQYNRRIDLRFESTGISADISYAAFNYSMWEYVMIALCVLMTVRLFSCEYSSGAYRTVNTSKKTVQSLFFKKLFAVVTVAVGVLAVQAIFELAMGACVFGLKNLSLPIQQIQMYEYCPYAMSIAQFYLFKFLLKVLAYVTIISLCAFVTTLVRRPLVSNIILLPISAGGLLANMVLFVKIDNAENYSLSVLAAYDRLRIFLPQSLLNFKEYIKKFDCFSLFGHPVSRLSACILISFAISALCVALGYKFSGRTRRSS